MGTPVIEADAAGITEKPGRVGGVVDKLLAPADVRVQELPLDHLYDNPDNPRGDVGDVGELAETVKHAGILEPLLVMSAAAFNAGQGEYGPHVTDPDGYVLIAGHRRRAAAREAGLATAPCIVRDDLAGAEGQVAMLIENLQRSDLDALEEARAFSKLRELKLSQRDIATRVGRNQSHISKRLQLLKLPESIADRIGRKAETGGITIDHAITIAKLSPVGQQQVADAIDRMTAPTVAMSVDRVVHDIAEELLTADLRAKALQILRQQGVDVLNADGPVLRSEPKFSGQDGPCPVDWLPSCTIDEHQGKPCHAAVVQEYCYQHHGKPEAFITYVCTDPQSHPLPEPTASPGQLDIDGNENPERTVEQRAQQAEWEARRAADEQRRKEADSANEQRAAFMRQLLAGKLPKRAAEHLSRSAVLEAILSSPGYDRLQAGVELLGSDEEHPTEPIVAHLQDGTGDLTRHALAIRLATDDEDLRNVLPLAPDRRTSWEESIVVGRLHLKFLAAAGYKPSDVEQAVIDDTTATVRAAALTQGAFGLREGDQEEGSA